MTKVIIWSVAAVAITVIMVGVWCLMRTASDADDREEGWWQNGQD